MYLDEVEGEFTPSLTPHIRTNRTMSSMETSFSDVRNESLRA
jgi:hypothetical protein